MTPSENPVRVLVVDDHQLFADALTMFLARDDRVEVIGTASNGEDGIAMALDRYADVVLMDVFMRGMDGLQATERLRSLRPETHVIVTSGISNDELAAEARAAGADGHLQKGAIHERVVDAVLQAAAGRYGLP